MFAVAIAHVAHFFPFVADDAFISLRYAERLLEGHGLTWTAGERVEGYTDLGWVLLTALLGALRVDLLLAARALGVVGFGLGVLAVSLTNERPTTLSIPRVVSGGLMLALCGPAAAWAIGALEHGFIAGVLLLTLWLLMRTDDAGRGERAGMLALLVLLVLLRADGAVLVAFAMAGHVLHRRSWRALGEAIRWGVVPLSVLGLQLVFRKAYYDAWVPNTALAKVSFNWGRVQWGAEQWFAWARFGWPSLLAAGVGAAVSFRSGRSRAWVPLTVSLGWMSYVISVGGDIFPAWRQLLLGIAPLFLLVSDGAEAWWSQAGRRGRTVLVAFGVGVLGVHGVLQRVDPENDRGVTERWEFEGEALGLFLRESFSAADPLLAVDAAGALPYYAKLRALDMLGLNDRWLATHPPPGFGHGPIGHELGNGTYVWERKPDILASCGAAGGARTCFISARDMAAHPDFPRRYQLMRFVSTFGQGLTHELWIRREDGPLGVVRSEREISVPGWLLAERTGRAELKERKLVTRVSALEPASMYALVLPAGSWELAVDPPNPALTVSVRCPSGQVPGQVSRFRLEAETPIDLFIGAKGADAFVQRAVFTQVDDVDAPMCGPVVEVDEAQLSTVAPENGFYLQPHGVSLSEKGLRVRLTPGHGARYQVSLDNNDLYEFSAFAGDTLLREWKLQPHRSGGLSLEPLEVPVEADTLHIRPHGGDGRYAIGHLVQQR
ncbi:MAG: hypothetical protein JNG84_09680 [Archangium sp.]|nr:hypothetical protein [Archangium sp.]